MIPHPKATPLPWLTADLLGRMIPNLSVSRIEIYAQILAEACPQFGLTTKTQFEEYIANVIHESSGLTRMVENMNYSANRMAQVWPNRFRETYTEEDKKTGKPVVRTRPNKLALSLVGKPIELANIVYANRMGNGGPASGDGWRFRGGGAIMQTGRAMYQRGAAFFGMTLNEYAQWSQEVPEGQIKSSLWIFCIEKSLLDEAERNEAKKIAIAINGGLVGWNDRETIRKRVARVLGL